VAKGFHTGEEVASFCTDAERIARTTYLRGLGKGFYDNEEMRSRLDLAARRGWMRGYILYANEKPCAFWLGTMYQNVLYLDYTGYDSELRDFTPGHILFLKMIEHLHAQEEICGIDFGFGDADYKKRFGDRNWEESDLYLFNATPAMVMANLAFHATEFMRSAAEKTAKRLSLFGSIKKQWRQSAKKNVGQS
jgi:CelD/BcsL family acetyltransferase involved in cellulose biosynthesis